MIKKSHFRTVIIDKELSFTCKDDEFGLDLFL